MVSNSNVTVSLSDEVDIIKKIIGRVVLKENIIPFNTLYIAYEKITRKEDLLSRIIAGFLNPNENHNFGYIPIKTFFQMIDVGYELGKNSNLKITTERIIENNRRIDIFIEWEELENGTRVKHAVIIENKLNWAREQKNQLDDYYDSIKKEKYVIDKIVVMPPVENYEPTARKEILNIIGKNGIVHLEKLNEWIDNCKLKMKKEQKGDFSLVHFQEFIKCLIENFYVMEKIEQIFRELKTKDEITKFEILVNFVSNNWEEWARIRFSPIVDKLPENIFGDDVTLQFEHDFESDEQGNKLYFSVFIYFELYKYRIKLRMKENVIELFIISEDDRDDRDKIKFKNIEFKQDKIYPQQFCYKKHFNIEQPELLLGTLMIILKELSEYKKIYRDIVRKLEKENFPDTELINDVTTPGLIINKVKGRRKIKLYITEKDEEMVITGDFNKLPTKKRTLKETIVSEDEAFNKLKEMIEIIINERDKNK